MSFIIILNTPQLCCGVRRRRLTNDLIATSRSILGAVLGSVFFLIALKTKSIYIDTAIVV
jgi:hypothetical protein